MQSTGTFTKSCGQSEQFEEEKIIFTRSQARWWFQTFFIFHPYLGKILTNFFQMGWSHQLNKSFFFSPSFLRRLIFTRRSWKAKIRFVGWLQGSEFLMTFFAMSLKLPCLGIDGVFASPACLILDGYICFLENDWKLLWTFPFSGWFRIHIFFETRNPPQNQLLKTQQTRQIFSDFQSLGEISQNESVYQTGSIIKDWVPSDPKIGTGLMIDRKDWSSWDCYAMIFLFLTRHWHALGTFFFSRFAWKKRFKPLRRRPLPHQATVVVVPKERFVILMAGADLWMWRMKWVLNQWTCLRIRNSVFRWYLVIFGDMYIYII